MIGFCAALTVRAEPGHPQLTDEQAKALIESLLVKSPYKLGEAARSGHIHYRLIFTGGPAPLLPETGEQRVVLKGNAADIDICNLCGDEATPSEADLQHYRSANAWVESDDRQIRAFARHHGRGGNLQQQMDRLSAAVRVHMDGPIDFRRYDSAATALKSRSGDCTEVALLLAATARARGIPARIAYGIAYSSRFTGKSHVFSPHAWVQVWDGRRWRSYDAGLGRFDAGHIALALGDGSVAEFAPAMEAMRRLRIDDAFGMLPAAADNRP